VQLPKTYLHPHLKNHAQPSLLLSLPSYLGLTWLGVTPDWGYNAIISSGMPVEKAHMGEVVMSGSTTCRMTIGSHTVTFSANTTHCSILPTNIWALAQFCFSCTHCPASGTQPIPFIWSLPLLQYAIMLHNPSTSLHKPTCDEAAPGGASKCQADRGALLTGATHWGRTPKTGVIAFSILQQWQEQLISNMGKNQSQWLGSKQEWCWTSWSWHDTGVNPLASPHSLMKAVPTSKLRCWSQCRDLRNIAGG